MMRSSNITRLTSTDNDESPIDNELGETAAAVLSRPTCSVEEFRTHVFPCSKNAAYEAIRRGEIAHVRLGKSIRVVTAPWRKKLGFGAMPPS
jgi:hypothetical protein